MKGAGGLQDRTRRKSGSPLCCAQPTSPSPILQRQRQMRSKSPSTSQEISSPWREGPSEDHYPDSFPNYLGDKTFSE